LLRTTLDFSRARTINLTRRDPGFDSNGQ